jgi:predicted nucleic acid-binding protein
MPYIADTHALVWHLTGSPKLGAEAAETFRRCEAGHEVILFPTIVLAELLHICDHGRVPIDFAHTLARIQLGDNYGIVPLDLTIIQEASRLGGSLELHDRLLAATAVSLGLPLITADASITASGIVRVLW